ncbi:MAG: hypothetical protein DI535_13055 [Citrobacter freundii]|nr:MAG: hypothetical protein DI535_13055 [Citrobacter freundii]
MKLIVLLPLLLCPCFSSAQDTLSQEVTRRYAYTFELDKNTVTGAGWDSLQRDISTSQFILIGENHSSPLLSLFTKHLLEAASKKGFHHFLLETGPVASRKLVSLYDKDETVFSKRLNGFLTQFKLKDGSPPAEFMAMKNDVPMYKAAIEQKYNIVGLDKEYVSSIDYLLNELGKYATKGSLKNEYEAALKRAAVYKKEENEKEDNPYITQCSTDSAISTFLDHIALVNKDAKFIVDEMRKTFLIYGLYENKKYRESEAVRIARYKKAFGDLYYKNSGGNPSSFKAIIKFGNAHMERGKSYLSYFDLGNTAAELAALNGNTSTHIYCMRRYRYNADGTVADFYNMGYEVYYNIITLTDQVKWTIIDLRPIRELMLNGKIKVNSKSERDLIFQNDIVLLIPVDGAYKASLNY